MADGEHELLTIAQILKAEKPHEDVEVPELGGWVRLHAVTGKERAQLILMGKEAGDDRAAQMDLVHTLIAYSLDCEPEQVAGLAGTAIDQLGVVAGRLAGIDAFAMRRAVAEVKATPNGESGSA